MTITKQIKQRVGELPYWQPFTAEAFPNIAKRATINRILGRMVKEGLLFRPLRGTFVRLRPPEGRLAQLLKGTLIPPDPMYLARALEPGEIVEPHGAAAINYLGLTTQCQVRPVYYTTGRTRTFKWGPGGNVAYLRHIHRRKLLYPGTKVGLVINALYYLGKGQIDTTTVEILRKQLTDEEIRLLNEATGQMPKWMVAVIAMF